MGDMVNEKRSSEVGVKEQDKNGQYSSQNGCSAVKMSMGDDSEEEDGVLYGDLPTEYRLVHKLGEGAFSAVYKAVYEPTGRPVAIKIINKANLSGKQIANIHNEINIMKRLSHPNVLRLVDLFNNDVHCYIVLEYCDGGEIFNKIISILTSARTCRSLYSRNFCRRWTTCIRSTLPTGTSNQRTCFSARFRTTNDLSKSLRSTNGPPMTTLRLTKANLSVVSAAVALA